MNIIHIEEVSVHPVDGMQLSEGYICESEQGYLGCVPGLPEREGGSIEDVRMGLEHEAKEYFGDDVVVELTLRDCDALTDMNQHLD